MQQPGAARRRRRAPPSEHGRNRRAPKLERAGRPRNQPATSTRGGPPGRALTSSRSPGLDATRPPTHSQSSPSSGSPRRDVTQWRRRLPAAHAHCAASWRAHAHCVPMASARRRRRLGSAILAGGRRNTLGGRVGNPETSRSPRSPPPRRRLLQVRLLRSRGGLRTEQGEGSAGEPGRDEGRSLGTLRL